MEMTGSYSIYILDEAVVLHGWSD